MQKRVNSKLLVSRLSNKSISQETEVRCGSKQRHQLDGEQTRQRPGIDYVTAVVVRQSIIFTLRGSLIKLHCRCRRDCLIVSYFNSSSEL